MKGELLKHVNDAYENTVVHEKSNENYQNEDAMDAEDNIRRIMDAVDYFHLDLHSETSGDLWHRVDERKRRSWIGLYRARGTSPVFWPNQVFQPPDPNLSILWIIRSRS